MTTDGMAWRQLEQNFDRLLEQEEEMEAETIAPPRNRPQRASTSKGNDQVRWLQKALNRVTRFGLAENGVPSIQTRKALQKFQAERGLRPTGTLGPKTRAALIRLSGIPAPRRVERDDDDTLYEVERFVDTCPVDNPHVIRGFAEVQRRSRVAPTGSAGQTRRDRRRNHTEPVRYSGSHPGWPSNRRGARRHGCRT